MNSEMASLDTLKDIKKMMEKSSRFISLSGWSGISAGVCGLAGAIFAHGMIADYREGGAGYGSLITSLVILAAIVFTAAFVAAFTFTYMRSRREGTPVWGSSARRLLWNTMLPMLVGGVVILRLINTGDYEYIAPCTLIFYGLALVNGGKYTLGEIRYIGYIEILLGIFNLWYPELWLVLWAFGFGVLHIVYGIIMWWRYERKPAAA